MTPNAAARAAAARAAARAAVARAAAARAAALLALALVLVLAVPGAALAKSFSVDEVVIGGNVSADGTLDISEARTLAFDGEFTRVVWSLKKRDAAGIEIVSVRDESGSTYSRTEEFAAIDDVSLRRQGTYVVEDGRDRVLVHVFHNSADEVRTFTLEYRVKGAAKRWEDTGELYWQLVGDETEVGTERFEARIEVDGVTSKEEMRAWAHGPLTGVVTIEPDGGVLLEADDIPPQTFVEVRMAFPAQALSQAEPAGGPRLSTILAEEQRAADEANQERMGARILVGAWTGGASLLALAALGFGIWAFLRYGREHRPGFSGQYFREDPRPDLHPAVIGALWRFGKVEDTDIAATLMELADKGVIRMSPVTVKKDGVAGIFGATEQSFTLERVREKQPPHALDRELIRLLFDEVGGGGDTVTLDEIEQYAKSNPQTFTEQMKAWKESAQGEAEALGFFEGESWSWQVGIFVAAVFVAAVSIFAAVQTGSPWPLCLPIPTAIALAVIGVFMRRRSRQGGELYRTYVAVRDFLKDFSRLEEAPPQSVVLWNRFLVLAVIFGVAEQVIEQLRVTVPEVVKDPAFQTSYWWVYGGSYGRSPVSALSGSFVSAAQVATSKMSSGSGGGGGFSGGGGFGGGGGGFGAD